MPRTLPEGPHAEARRDVDVAERGAEAHASETAAAWEDAGFAFTHDPLLGTIACHRGDDSRRAGTSDGQGGATASERCVDTTGFDAGSSVFYAGADDADAEARTRGAARGDLDDDSIEIESAPSGNAAGESVEDPGDHGGLGGEARGMVDARGMIPTTH